MCHNPSFVVPLIGHRKSRGLIILTGPQIFKIVNNTEVWSLGQEDSLEKGMATHSSILHFSISVFFSVILYFWRIQWTEEVGGLSSIGLHRVCRECNHLISVLIIWWCPCVESSFVLLEEGVCYDQCVLLAKLCYSLPCFILYCRAKLACYSSYLLTSYFSFQSPLM